MASISEVTNSLVRASSKLLGRGTYSPASILHHLKAGERAMRYWVNLTVIKVAYPFCSAIYYCLHVDLVVLGRGASTCNTKIYYRDGKCRVPRLCHKSSFYHIYGMIHNY